MLDLSCAIWDLVLWPGIKSSPCIRSVESYPLNHQGSFYNFNSTIFGSEDSAVGIYFSPKCPSSYSDFGTLVIFLQIFHIKLGFSMLSNTRLLGFESFYSLLALWTCAVSIICAMNLKITVHWYNFFIEIVFRGFLTYSRHPLLIKILSFILFWLTFILRNPHN